MPANTTFTAGAVLTAQQMNNLPWGIVDATAGGTSGRGFVNRLSGNFTITTTEADVTGLTVTWTAVTGRLYRITFNGWVANVATAQEITMYIKTGANVFTQTATLNLGSAANDSFSISTVLTGLTGTQTYKARAKASAANGAVLVASTGNEAAAVFTVEDIGPSS
jgi:hypothetical protein